MVQEVVTDRRTVCVGYQCVPKVVTKHVPIKICETVPVTKYRKVKRLVAVCPPVSPMVAAVAVPSLQGAALAAPQTTASQQN